MNFDEIEGEVKEGQAPRFDEIEDTSAQVPPGRAAVSAPPEELVSKEEPLPDYIQNAEVTPASFAQPTVLPDPKIGSFKERTLGEAIMQGEERQKLIGSPLLHPIKTLQNVKDNAITPAQEQYGAPVVDGVVQVSKFLDESSAKMRARHGFHRSAQDLMRDQPMSESILRSGLQLIGGDQQLNDFGVTDEGKKAADLYEEKLGVTGGAYVQGLAQEVGKLPIYILGGEVMQAGKFVGETLATAGLGGEFAVMFPRFYSLLEGLGGTVGSMIGGGIEGYGLGGLEAALTPGADVGAHMEGGAQLGAALPPAFEAGAKLISKGAEKVASALPTPEEAGKKLAGLLNRSFPAGTAETLAFATPDGTVALMDELSSMPIVSTQPKTAYEVLKSAPDDFEPTVALLGPEGKLRLTEIDVNGNVRVLDIPDDLNASRVMRSYGIEVMQAPPIKSADIVKTADGLLASLDAKKVRPKPVVKTVKAEEINIQKTAPGKKRKQEAAPREYAHQDALDNAPVGQDVPPPVMIVRKGNKLKVKSLEDPPARNTIDVGDDVVVAKGNNGEPGVVMEKTAPGKVRVRTPTGDEVVDLARVAKNEVMPQKGMTRRLEEDGFDIFVNNEDVRKFLNNRKRFTIKQFAKALDVSEAEAARAVTALDAVHGVKQNGHTYEPTIIKLRAQEAQGTWDIPRNQKLNPNDAFPDANPKIGKAFDKKDVPPAQVHKFEDPRKLALQKQLDELRAENDRLKNEMPPPVTGYPPLPEGYKWQRGDKVFTGRSAGPTAEYGVIVGKGERDGHIAVMTRPAEGEPTVVEVAETALHPITIAKNKDLFRGTQPELSRPLVAGDIPADLSHEYDRAAALVASMRAANPSTFDKILNNIIPMHFRGPLEQRQRVLQMMAAKQLENPDDLFKDIVEGMGGLKELRKEFDLDVAKVSEGQKDPNGNPLMTPADMQKKYGDKWTRFRDQVLEGALRERDQLEKDIIALGGLPDDIITMREDGAFDYYVARMYHAYMDRKNWKKYVTQDAINNAITRLSNVIEKERGLVLSGDLLGQEIMRIMSKEDPLRELIHSDIINGGSKLPSFNALKSRKDLPKPIAALMGEEMSGAVRLAQTLANQRGIKANLAAWAEITDLRAVGPDGKDFNPFWSPGPRPDLPVQIPNEPKLYGKAAGGYTDEVYGQLINLPKLTDNTMGWLHNLMGWVKFNEVAAGGPQVWLTNTMGNVMFSSLAGGLDLLHPVRSGQAFRKALAASLEHLDIRNGLKRTGEMADLIREAHEFGAIMSGFGQSEMRGADGEVMRHLKNVLAELPENASIFAYMKRIGQLTSSKANAGKAWVSKMHDLNDDVFKLANYIALKQKFLPKYGNNEQAAKMAAYRINQSFPNMSPGGGVPLAERMNRAGVGLVAKYLRYFTESARIFGSVPMRLSPVTMVRDVGTGKLRPELNDESRELWVRMGITAAFTYGMFGDNGAMGHLRRINGITDAEVELAKKRLTNEQERYRPFMLALPWRDEQGRVQLLDATSWFDPAKYLSGHPADPVAKKIAANMLIAPVSGGAAEDAFDAFFQKINLIKAKRNASQLEGNDALVEAVNTGAKIGLVPKVIPRGYDQYKNATTKNPAREKLSPMQAAVNMFAKVQPVTTDPEEFSPSGVASARENILTIKTQLKSNLLRINMSPDMGEDEKQRRREATIQEAIRAGLDQQSINEAQAAVEAERK